MRKIGAETIILFMLIPILLTISGYVSSKVFRNSEDISRLDESDSTQKKQLNEIHRDIKTILRRVR